MNLNGLVADEYAIGVVEEDAVGGPNSRGVVFGESALFILRSAALQTSDRSRQRLL
jgi:hypothetical protein